jgi:hypothetical protein
MNSKMDEKFVASLGKRLAEAASAPVRRRPARLVWGVALGIPVLLLVIFLIVGPDKVVSAMARLFGYAPAMHLPTQAVDEPTPVVFKTLPSDPDTLELLQSLHEKSLSQNRAGWLHIYAKTTYSPDYERGMSESGVDLTDEEVWDQWLLLDENGYVQRQVRIQYNANGEIVQVAVTGDGTGWNSWSDGISPWSPYSYVPGHILSDYQSYREAGIAPSISEVVLPDGTGCILITYAITYFPPLEIGQMKPVTVIGSIASNWVDEKTGLSVVEELRYTFKGGTSEVVSHSELMYTFQNPPEEILKWFEEKEARERRN